MIQQTNTRVLDSTVKPKEIAAYHVDPKNLRQIFQMLREMYSDPKLAVVREYSANARDAHVSAGVPHRPIEITLPTLTDPVIAWRDFGHGLTNDDLKTLILGYGASGDDKRRSNELIGGFGIGGKCGFAVADQFTVISYHGGMRNEWQCYRDQDDDCNAMLVSETESTEPSGMEVRIPVPWQDVSEYTERIENAFLFYPVRPVLFRADKALKDRVNRTLPSPFLFGNLKTIDRSGQEIPIRWEAVKDPDYKDFQVGSTATSDLSFARVVMGGIAYPIQLERLGVSGGATETFFRRIILYAPIGSLQLAPSRETLAYTPRVINMLKGVFGEIINQSGDTAMAAISTATCCRDKLNILSSLHAAVPKLSSLTKELIEKFFIGINGLAVPLKDAVCVKTFTKSTQYNVQRGTYAWQWYVQNHGNKNKTGVHMVPADSGNPNLMVAVVVGMNDTSDKLRTRDIAGKVFASITDDKNCEASGDQAKLILIGVPYGTDTRIPWMKDGSVRRFDLKDLDQLKVPSAIVEEFLRTSAADDEEGEGEDNNKKSRSSNSQSYAQHSRKFVRLDTVSSASRSHRGNVKSQDWAAVTARSLEDSRKVYVVHEGFAAKSEVAPNVNSGFLATGHLRRVVDGSKFIPEMGDMRTSGILAVRERDHDSIKGLTDFVHFWAYIREVFDKLTANGLTEVCLVQTLLMVEALVEDGGKYENNVLQWTILQNGYRWVDENPKLLSSSDPLARAICEFRAATKYLLGNQKGLNIFRHFVMPLYWLARASRISLPELLRKLGISFSNKDREKTEKTFAFSTVTGLEVAEYVRWVDDKSLYAKMVKRLHAKPGFLRYLAVSTRQHDHIDLTWLYGNTNADDKLPESVPNYQAFTTPLFDTFPVSDFIDLSGEEEEESEAT